MTKAPTCPRCKGDGRYVDEISCCVCRGSGEIAADYVPRPLKGGQREILERIRASGADGFTERDWTLALTLRDAGLIASEDLPGWKHVPVVRHFKKRIVVTWLGKKALTSPASTPIVKTEED